MSSKREKRQRWVIQQHIIKYWTQWLLCKTNRQENRGSTGVSCVPKMKSLIENNVSALRQMAQRKRRRTRKRALITIKQRTKQMGGLGQMQAWGSGMSPTAHIQHALILKVTPANLKQPQRRFLERPMFHHQHSLVVHLHHRESTSAWDRVFMGCRSPCVQRLMLKILIQHLYLKHV